MSQWITILQRNLGPEPAGYGSERLQVNRVACRRCTKQETQIRFAIGNTRKNGESQEDDSGALEERR